MTRSGTLRWPAVLWLASRGGLADRTRIVLTALGAAAGTLALLAAATVADTGPGDGPYTSDLLNQPGLHPGIVVALLLLCLPLLGFVGQCTRIGAPARDRRLATLRLAGATPGAVVRVACAETGIAATLGALLGLAAYLVLRVLLGSPVGLELVDDGSRQLRRPLRLPTDVLPPVWVLVILVAAVPLGSVLFAGLALRRVTVSPFGLVRRQQTQPRRAVPLALFGVGVLGLAAFGVLQAAGVDREQAFTTWVVVAGTLFVMTGVGLVAGSAAVAALVGRILAARARRPAVLIAARRLAAEPFAASRANAAVLLTVLLGAATEGIGSAVFTGAIEDDPFYSDALHLVDLVIVVAVALATAGLLVSAIEGIVTRRRSLAALAAVGVPRRVLRRAVLLQAILPLIPGVLLAAAAGILAARGVYGTSVPRNGAETTQESLQMLAIPVPWTPLVLLVAGSLLLTLVVTAAALVFLRRSVEVGELRTPA